MESSPTPPRRRGPSPLLIAINLVLAFLCLVLVATAALVVRPSLTPAPTSVALASRTATRATSTPDATAAATATPIRQPTRGQLTPLAATPRPLNSLSLVMTRGDPPTFDPALASDTASHEVIAEIFSGLVTIDRNLEIKPDLAESWKVSGDGKTFTFTLQANARFGNGKKITAQDFKYSFERAADPALGSTVAETHLGDIVGVKAKLAGRARDIQGVKAIDDRTIQITIDAPKVYFLSRLATSTAFVVDRENVEQGGRNWFLHPNGSGPFRLLGYTKGDQLVLERNDLYPGSPKPAVKTIVLHMPTGDSYVEPYLDGELDSAPLYLDEVPIALDPRSPVRQQVMTAPVFRLEYLGLNTHIPPFDDVKVRQAFALAIDRKTIADRVLEGEAVVAKGIFPPNFPGYNPDLEGWDYNPWHARDLIKQSKYHDVKNLPEITLQVNAPNLVTQAVVDMLRQNLGIDVTISVRDFAGLIRDLGQQPNPVQMYHLGLVAQYPDPIYLEPSFYSQSRNNSTGYKNARVDQLFDAARTEPDKAKRISLYQQAEKIIVDDAPWIPLVFGGNYWLIKPYVKGLVYPPVVLPRFKYVSLDLGARTN